MHPLLTITSLALIYMLVALTLSSCASYDISTSPQERTKLELNLPDPLVVRTVDWKVFEIDGDVWYALNKQDFKRLRLNETDMTDRLFFYRKALERQTDFYENLNE